MASLRLGEIEAARLEKKLTTEQETDRFISSGQHLKTLNDLPNPGAIPGFYGTKRPNVKQMQVTTDPQWLKEQRQGWFSDQVEEAYYTNRGQFPLQWLVQQHEEDLKFFTNPDFMPEISENLRNAGAIGYYDRVNRRKLEERAAAAFENELSIARMASVRAGVDYVRDHEGGIFGAGDRFISRMFAGGEEGYQEEFDARRAEIESLYAARIEGKPFRPEDLAEAEGRGEYDPDKAFDEDLQAFMLTGIQGVGDIFSGITKGVSAVLSVTNENDILSVMGVGFRERKLDPAEEQELSNAQESLRALTSGEQDEDLKRYLMQNELPTIAWQQMQTENPDKVQEFIEMYGPEAAYMGFALEFQDWQNDPDSQQQMDKWIEDGYVRPAQEYVDNLEDSNYRNQQDILKTLSFYNEGITGVASFAVAAGKSAVQGGPDRLTDGFFDNFRAIAEMAEAGGHTPSGVLGLDGTAVGLGIDFILPQAFDPITYLFGPRGTFGASHVSTSAAAEMAANSPLTRAAVRDSAVVLLAEDRLAAGKAATLTPFVEVGLGGDMLGASGLVDNFFPAHQWLNSSLGRAGHHVDLDFANSLLDSVQEGKIAQLNPETVTQTANSLRNNGFLEPLVFGIEKETGRLFLEEGGGLKRIAAMRQLRHEANGPTSVPVVFREYKPPPPTELATKIAQNQGDYIFHTTTVPKAGAIQAEGMKAGGLSDLSRAEEFAYIGLDNKTPQRIVVFERSQFPSNIQKALEETGDYVNDLQSVVDMTAIPPIRPVAVFDAEQGVLSIGRPAGPTGVTFEELGLKPPASYSPIDIDGANYYNPRSMFDNETLGLKADEAALDSILEEGLKRGMDLGAVRQNATSLALGKMFHSALKAGAARLEPYLASVFNQTRISMAGGLKGIMEMTQFLSASQPEWANHWLQAIMENQRALNTAKSVVVAGRSELNLLRRVQEQLRQMSQGSNGWSEAVESGIFGDLFDGQKFSSLAEAQQAVLNRMKETQNKLKTTAYNDAGARSWDEFFAEMMEDYKTQYIETNPEWASLLDENGKLDWSHIHRGTNLTEEGLSSNQINPRNQQALRDQVKANAQNEILKQDYATKFDPEQVVGRMRSYRGNIEAVTLPATPIELMAATTRGGAKYTAMTQNINFAALRAMVKKMDALWKTNVLASPRLFGVLSVDELTSMAMEFGNEFIMRYAEARTASITARLKDLVHNQHFRSTSGSQYLSESSLNKLRALEDIPSELRTYQNSLWDADSTETIMLNPEDQGYRKAAQVYVQRHLENPAFRAYLGGPDELAKWIDTPEGESWILNNPFRTPEGTYTFIKDAQEASDLLDFNWRVLEEQAKKLGMSDPVAFRGAWEQAAAESGTRTGRTAPIAPFVYDYLGPLEGTRPIYPGSSVGWGVVSSAFEKFADNPAMFRQALLANMMRKAETARLTSLFESQGKRVMGDDEVLRYFENRGMPGGSFDPLHAEWLDQELLDQGMVTSAYVSRMAENRARDWVHNMTYSFEQGSRAGKTGSVVFPFGRPWGDMWARWGRSIGAEAILRPWVQGLPGGKQLQAAMARLPINPRAFSRLSRLANTDLRITGGFVGEQETDLDFSPFMFLPTESGGVNALIPGLGPFAILGVDKAIDLFGPDPTEDPIAYNQLLESMSDYIPAMGLHGRDPTQRLLGSGLTGLMLNLGSDLGMGLFHNPNRFLGLFTGNLSSELRRSRAVSAQLADPTLMNDILMADDPDVVIGLLLAAWKDGNTHAMKVNLWDSFSSWIVPVNGALDTSLDTLYGSWVEVGRSYPTLFTKYNMEYTDEQLQRDPDLLKRTGDDVRRRFWELEPWERDLIVATNPTLASNLITTWEWAPSAPSTLSGRDTAYRFGIGDVETTTQALAQHEAFVKNGWVIPRDTSKRPFEIVGRALVARQNIAKELYTTAMEETNDFIWTNVVSPESKAKLDAVLTAFPVLGRIGITDTRQLWTKWGSQRETVLDSAMETLGVDPDSEEGIEVRKQLLEATRIPEEEESWSTSWRSDDPEEFSSRARKSPILLNDKTKMIADKLGLDITDGMSGEDFIAEIVGYRSQAEGAAWNAVRYNYDEYTDGRGRSFAMAESTLNDLSQNPQLDEEWRMKVKEFVDWSANIGDLRTEEGRLSRRIQDQAVAKFMALASSGREAPVNWDRLWRDGFQTAYGPLNWEPPVPKEPLDQDGSLGKDTWMPYVRSVLDGDTIEVSQNLGPSIFPGAVRPEFGPGETRVHKVRLLGVMAADYDISNDGAEDDTHRLEQALLDAQRRGDRIYLVRDPDYAGSPTDPFGRELAWLWIGDEPYYFPDELKRGT